MQHKLLAIDCPDLTAILEKALANLSKMYGKQFTLEHGTEWGYGDEWEIVDYSEGFGEIAEGSADYAVLIEWIVRYYDTHTPPHKEK